MTEFIAAFIVFGIAVAGMAAGVIISRKRLLGSCGGLAGLRDEQGRTSCEACSNPSPECSGENAQQQQSSPRSPPSANVPEETAPHAAAKR